MNMGKRLFDIFFSIIGLTVCSPILLTIVCLILILDGKPVFFRQERLGKSGKPFTLYKFRTMRKTFDGDSRKEEDRITKLGDVLRATSIDELPNFFNVLSGSMSVVGPRPLLLQYKDRFDQMQLTRLNVNPGITGWAQIKGRNSLSWAERLDLDVWYAEHHTILLDVRIIAHTILAVVMRKGVSPEKEKIMPEFFPTQNKKNDTEQ